MKKLLPLSILLVALLLFPKPAAYAFRYTPVRVTVPVEIGQGGTAVMNSEVNCPIPETGELRLADGEVGRFDIDFTEPGSYAYSVQVQPDGRKITFDTTVYTVRVFVTDDNGVLTTTVVVFDGDEKYAGQMGSDGTPGCLIFANVPHPPKPTEPTKPSGGENGDTTKPSGGESDDPTSPDKRNPDTGDDSMMERYFLVAMIASAGLLVLSVIYLSDTNKMIRNKKHTD
ncbi:MAG: hypothetical protein II621_02230 [Clostridia bacterium]|nr:hypothetical protein [Clostridia bacterium]